MNSHVKVFNMDIHNITRINCKSRQFLECQVLETPHHPLPDRDSSRQKGRSKKGLFHCIDVKVHFGSRSE